MVIDDIIKATNIAVDIAVDITVDFWTCLWQGHFNITEDITADFIVDITVDFWTGLWQGRYESWFFVVHRTWFILQLFIISRFILMKKFFRCGIFRHFSGEGFRATAKVHRTAEASLYQRIPGQGVGHQRVCAVGFGCSIGMNPSYSYGIHRRWQTLYAFVCVCQLSKFLLTSRLFATLMMQKKKNCLKKSFFYKTDLLFVMDTRVLLSSTVWTWEVQEKFKDYLCFFLLWRDCPKALAMPPCNLIFISFFLWNEFMPLNFVHTDRKVFRDDFLFSFLQL